ncbi:MAG TPA: 3-oxoadipyl-CoA thiolase, partial [Bacteroidetes bacterium]|nr:3-oxoadipyl-CoA thiolase [Bacteroidota bacterium]
MSEAWIVEAVRTPIGRYGKSLALTRPDDLAGLVLQKAAERAQIPPQDIEDVYFGCANQAGEDNRNVARMGVLLAGFPVEVPGCTVNRLCGSGLEAIAQAARAVMLGDGDLYLAGGVESMSRAPHVLPKAERAFPAGSLTVFDTALGWRMVNPKMEQLGHTDSLGQTAENLAGEYGISREQQDRFALHSHQKALQAIAEKKFADEIVPVQTKAGLFSVDECPRSDTSM